MNILHSQVIVPSNLSELFSVWNRFPGAVPFAGGTSFMRKNSGLIPELPKIILSLERIDELVRAARTERYLELGAMVKLNEIAALGKTVPEVLSKTFLGIAGPQLRSLATIGGNICSIGKPGGATDAAAPLTALDARFELRSVSQSRWISAQRFFIHPDSVFERQEFLSRIRVPLEIWNYAFLRKFHGRDLAGETGGILICTAKNEKNILTDIRIVFAGSCLLRDRNSENYLQGKKLPLDKKDAFHCRELWKQYLEEMEQPGLFLKTKLINGVEACLLELAG